MRVWGLWRARRLGPATQAASPSRLPGGGGERAGWAASGEGHPEGARQHLWLARAPSAVERCVWQVVTLAALDAMEVNKEIMHSQMREVRGSAAVPPWKSFAWQALRLAVPCMWAHLHASAHLGMTRKWGGTRSTQPTPGHAGTTRGPPLGTTVALASGMYVWIYSFGPLPGPSPVPLGRQS